MGVLEEIWDDYKNIIIIVGIVIIVLIIGFATFSIVYDPIKISFTGDDAKVVATMSNELKIGAVATNKKNKEFDISWQTSAGTLNTDKGSEVTWELPEQEGTYSIVAKAGDKTKTKNVTIIKNQLGDLSLSNNEDVKLIDNDFDGLSDNYEKEISTTQELNADSDGDIVNDGNEIILGLNPNAKESGSKNDQDNEIESKYTLKNDNIGINILFKGKDNIASSSVDLYDLNTINEIDAVISKVYSIKTQGTLTNANISIKYDKNIVSKNSLDENKLSIYKLDTQNNKFIKQNSSVDSANSTVSATVTELGMFFLADSSKMKEKVSTELMFVIDNSGSMYSKEMVDGSQENDTQFKRVDLSNSIIDKLKGDYKFGAGKFTFEYSELIGMTNDKQKIKEEINSIKTSTEKFSGTYIGNALEGGLKQFDNKNNDVRKYLILLTDGKDTKEVEGYDEKKLEKATLDAKNKNVKVFTIGLGEEIDSKVLQKISTQTGGKYYYASSSKVLEDVFELIAADINYCLVDLDKDSNDDYIILGNSDFLAKQNGMPIENFSSTTNKYGATYGMCLFSKLYFEDKMPSKMSEISVKNTDTNEIQKTNGYDIRIGKDTKGILLNNYELKDLSFMKENPKDFMASTVSDGTLNINDTYKKKLALYGASYYYLTPNNNNAQFKKYENYKLNTEYEDKETSSKSTSSKEDKNFINAIYRLDILKYRDERISFEKEPDKAFAYVIEVLKKGEVPIVILNNSYTVAIEKVLVDINDSNHFKFEVYDSNYGGDKKLVDIKRTKIFNSLKSNDSNEYEYKFTYNEKNVDVSVSIPNIDTNL